MLRKSRLAATTIISVIVLFSMIGATLSSPSQIGTNADDVLFTWSAKELVATVPHLGFATPVDIAVDDAGNTYVLWWNFGTYFTYRPVSGGWSAPELVNDAPYQGGGTSATLEVSIAIDSSGVVYAMWVDYRNIDAPDIAFSYRPVGGIWQPNTIVNDVAGNSILPDMAVDSFGNAYAVWIDYRNDPNGIWCSFDCNNDVYFSYRPAGGNWGANVKVNDDTGTLSQRWPALAVDGSGNAYSVWVDNRNDIFSRSDLFFSYRPSGGSWGANIKVNEAVTSVFLPVIAVDSANNAYTLWEDGNNGGDIFFSYLPSGESWGSGIRINDDTGSEFQLDPALTVDAVGNAHAAWTDHRNGNYDIFYSYRPVGGSWSANISITGDPQASGAQGPKIATNSSGRAYGVWSYIFDGDLYFSYQQEIIPIPTSTPTPTPTSTPLANCTPNDLHPYQWDMLRINLVGALNQFPNCQATPIKIAIIDTGVNASHPELQGKIIPGGYSVGKNIGDKNGHGTHIAGTIAAIQNNFIGISGIHPNAQLVIYKAVNDPDGYNAKFRAGFTRSPIENVADFIIDAVQVQHVKVINISMGVDKDLVWNPIGPDYLTCKPHETEDFTCGGTLEHAITIAEQNEVMIVVAAGNTGNEGFIYPAAYARTHSNVIAVVASTTNDTLANYSTTGDYITVAAPGGNGVRCQSGLDDCILSLGLRGRYVENQGTSMAAPHVTGVVALMLSANDQLSPEDIRNIIRDEVTPYSSLPIDRTEGTYGQGILNAMKVVMRAFQLK
jgi:hypothetical protein